MSTYAARYRILLAGLMVLVAFGVWFDFHNMTRGGHMDLRNRVVGARVMLRGGDPYTYRWRPGAPETLLDPTVPVKGPISKVTVTPAVLLVHCVFAPMGYLSQEYIWFFIELALYAALVWVSVSQAGDAVSRAAILLAALIFSCSYAWRLHVDAGQVYILFAFLAVAAAALLRKPGVAREFGAGFLAGLLSSLRPNYALLALAPLACGRLYCLAGMALGGAVGVAGPLAISRTVWVEYFHLISRYLTIKRIAAPGAWAALPSQSAFPASIEGISTFFMVAYEHIPGWGVDSSLSGVLRLLGVTPPGRVFLALAAAGIAGWALYLLRTERGAAELRLCFIRTLGLVLFSEMVLPIPRMWYSDVLSLAIILSLISEGGAAFLRRPAVIPLIAVSLLFFCGFAWVPKGLPGLISCTAVLALVLLRGSFAGGDARAPGACVV